MSIITTSPNFFCAKSEEQKRLRREGKLLTTLKQHLKDVSGTHQETLAELALMFEINKNHWDDPTEKELAMTLAEKFIAKGFATHVSTAFFPDPLNAVMIGSGRMKAALVAASQALPIKWEREESIRKLLHMEVDWLCKKQ